MLKGNFLKSQRFNLGQGKWCQSLLSTRIAQQLHRQTPLSRQWIADWLRIGSASYYFPVSIASSDSIPLLVFGKYSACLQTRIHVASQYFRDLCFLKQKKLLHTQVFPGNGSMVVGNSSAPAPRGFVFLSSFSCARALS
jgi:hypothetical protein